MKQISCYADAATLRDFVQSMGENSPTLTEAKRAQVYYLYHIAELVRREIAQITGYAPSTLSSMRNNVADYAELAETLFVDTRSKETQKPVSAALCRRCGDTVIPIEVLAGAGVDTDRTNKVYLFKFYGENEIPIFSKIGTTTRTCVKRLRDEIGDYYNAGFPIQRVEICKIIDVGSMPPEGAESYLRGLLMIHHPNAWRKNDRYFDTDIVVSIFEKLVAEFLKMEI